MQPRNPLFIKNILNLILLAAITCILASCATFIPREYLIPKDRMVEELQKHSPLHREKGTGVFSITVTAPRLSLIPEQNRVGIDSEFSAKASKLGFEGHFQFTSGLRYDAEQRAVFLKEARIDSLQTKNGNDLPEAVRSLINRMLSDSRMKNPVYRFRPSELVVLGTEIEVEAIEVVSDGILLKLRPVQQGGR
jgi:hypothetical protein